MSLSGSCSGYCNTSGEIPSRLKYLIKFRGKAGLPIKFPGFKNTIGSLVIILLSRSPDGFHGYRSQELADCIGRIIYGSCLAVLGEQFLFTSILSVPEKKLCVTSLFPDTWYLWKFAHSGYLNWVDCVQVD